MAIDSGRSRNSWEQQRLAQLAALREKRRAAEAAARAEAARKAREAQEAARKAAQGDNFKPQKPEAVAKPTQAREMTAGETAAYSKVAQEVKKAMPGAKVHEVIEKTPALISAIAQLGAEYDSTAERESGAKARQELSNNAPRLVRRALPPAPQQASTAPTSAAQKPAAPKGQVFFQSQIDPKWANVTLGSSRTIGSHGCAITSIAMAASAVLKRPVTPLEIDKAHPYDGNNVIWGSAAKAIDPRLNMSMENLNVDRIMQSLQRGVPAVIGVDHSGSSDTDHWISIVGAESKNGQTVFTALDPLGQPGSDGKMSMTLQGGRLVGNAPGGRQYRSTNELRILSGLEGPSLTSGDVKIQGGTSGVDLGKGITVDQFCAIVPTLDPARAKALLPFLNASMKEVNINTPERAAAYIAQLAQESAGFATFEEYASGAAYEGRSDLGNTQPGDGVRFKGRGAIQLTGRANYTAASQHFGVDFVKNPELLEKPEWAFRVAAYYWDSRNLNELADRGDFVGITKKINGGTAGLATRQAYYNKALSVLGGSLSNNAPIATGDYSPSFSTGGSYAGGAYAGGAAAGASSTVGAQASANSNAIPQLSSETTPSTAKQSPFDDWWSSPEWQALMYAMYTECFDTTGDGEMASVKEAIKAGTAKGISALKGALQASPMLLSAVKAEPELIKGLLENPEIAEKVADGSMSGEEALSELRSVMEASSPALAEVEGAEGTEAVLAEATPEETEAPAPETVATAPESAAVPATEAAAATPAKAAATFALAEASNEDMMEAQIQGARFATFKG